MTVPISQTEAKGHIVLERMSGNGKINVDPFMFYSKFCKGFSRTARCVVRPTRQDANHVYVETLHYTGLISNTVLVGWLGLGRKTRTQFGLHGFCLHEHSWKNTFYACYVTVM